MSELSKHNYLVLWQIFFLPPPFFLQNLQLTYKVKVTSFKYLSPKCIPVTFSFFIEMHVPNRESEWLCICVFKDVDFIFISTIFLLDFGTVPTVWCFLFFC